MSKRELKAKQILVAILCAASMQVWSAPPVWSAQPVGDTAVSGQIDKKTKTADAANKDAEETAEAEAAAQTEEVLASDTPTIGGYSISPRLAGASTYAVVETIGDIMVSGGMMQGVTTINNAKFTVGGDSIAIGIDDTKASSQGIAFGDYAQANGVGSISLGYKVYANGKESIIIGTGRADADYSVALGKATLIDTAHTNGVAIGYGSTTTAANQVSFGSYNPAYKKWDILRSLVGIQDIEMAGALSGVTTINGANFTVEETTESIAIGINAQGGNHSVGVGSQSQSTGEQSIAVGTASWATGDSAIAIGSNAGAIAIGGIAIGNSASVETEHTDSVAIGSGSQTSAANQVAFGDLSGGGNPSTFRSLAGIKDIALTGAITGATSINGIGIDSSRNLTNVGTINGVDLSTLSGADFTNIQSNIVVKKVDSTETFKVDQNTGNVTAGTFNGLKLYGSTSDIAIGVSAQVTGGDSIAIGYMANAASGEALAIGASSTADARSIAVGNSSTAEGIKSIALGYGTTVASGHTGSVAIGSGSKTSAANQVVFGDMTTPTSFRSLAGIKDIALTGAITGATSISGIDIDSNRNLTNVGTINGVDVTKLSGADFTNIQSDIAVKNTGNATTFSVDRNTGNVQASGTVTANEFVEGTTKLVDKYAGKSDFNTLNNTVTAANTGLVDQTAALKTNKADKTYVDSNFAKSTDVYTKTEVNTQLGNKANADASGLTDTNKTAWKTALGVDTLETTVADKADTTTVTALTGRVDTAEGTISTLETKTAKFNAAGTTLTGMTNITSTSATLGDVTFAANGVVTGVNSLNGIGINASGDLSSAGTYNGVTIGSGGISGVSVFNGATITSNSFNGAVISSNTFNGVDVGALKNTVDNLGSSGGVTAENTAGITRAKIDPTAGTGADNFKTTVEANTSFTTAGITTNAITASGTVTANEFVEGSTKLSDKYAGKNEAYTDAKAALKADKTYVDGNFAKSTDVYTKTEVNTQLGNKANADASGLTDTNKTAWKTALGVDTLETTLTDISYNNLTSTTTVGGVNFAAGGVVTNVASINGIRIDSSGNLTNAGTYNGATIDSKTFNGVDVEALKTTVDKLESSGGGGGGGSSQNTAGIKRTDANSDGTDDTTTIENATSFTTNGMKTSNLQAATAAIGGVNFGGSGALNNVASINGISFAGSKIGGVDLSGGKVDGVSISSLNNRVSALENSGGSGGGGGGSTGGGANTEGITRPDNSHTTIEGNTTIGADGVDTNDLTASGSITVAKGETNQTVIDKDGIHVGKNSSVVNDTDGFITDKGLYIGVESSSNLGSAKFSVAPNGNLSSTAGNYGFSNTSTDGAKFTDTGSIAHGGGSVMDTTIKGNTVTTGRVDTDELYVGGNKVVISGSTVQPGTHIDNHLEGTDASGNKFINDFTTSALNGTTQSAEKESADGKNTIKTTNNTSATGTSNTTAKTDVDGSDNTTVQKSELTTNENGMKLNTSNTVTDKNGTVTSSSSGETNMTGDSLTVSKTTTTKDADGNDVTKTSSTTVGSGEVTLNREDGSSIRVGDAIEGLQSDVQELGGRINEMGVEIKEVGALSAALAGLHPQPQNANTKADFAMAMGSYEGKQALAVGAFYRPDKRVMLSMGASTTSSKHMMNMGISIALDRMPEAERKAQEAGTADNETLNKVLERLEKLELENQKLSAENKKRDADYEKLAGDYAELKEKYAEEKTAE